MYERGLYFNVHIFFFKGISFTLISEGKAGVIHIGVQSGGGDGPSPPLLGHFVKDFTKTVDFSQYSPPLQSRPPLLSCSVRP